MKKPFQVSHFSVPRGSKPKAFPSFPYLQNTEAHPSDWVSASWTTKRPF